MLWKTSVEDIRREVKRKGNQEYEWAYNRKKKPKNLQNNGAWIAELNWERNHTTRKVNENPEK